VIPVANARMYSVAPSAAAAWRRLFEHVIAVSGVEMAVIDHPPPAGLPELWARPDLGAAFMCGWPFAREGGTRPILAAPVPAGSGGPVYRAAFVVAAASPCRGLEEVFGRRFAFNATHSHSGWNLPFAHLHRLEAPPFQALVGPFVTHQRSIEAVAEGAADVASVDSFVLDLLRLHDEALAARVRVIGVTEPSPIPLLVGGALAAADHAAFRAALLELNARELLDPLALERFTSVTATDYTVTLAAEQDAGAFARRHALQLA
jgi:ABC-type phosphate/phosphonate transport system substrate-binding protein